MHSNLVPEKQAGGLILDSLKPLLLPKSSGFA
jgi:hypothetical protein